MLKKIVLEEKDANLLLSYMARVSDLVGIEVPDFVRITNAILSKTDFVEVKHGGGEDSPS